MKLINHTEKPFEFTFDSVHRMIQPGEIVDLPDYQASIALRQSEVLDSTNGDTEGEGMPTGETRLRPLADMDGLAVKAMLRFECPYGGADLCQAGTFRSMEELRAHIDTHLPAVADFDLVAAGGARASNKK